MFEHVGVRHEDADGPGLAWGVESICEQLTMMGCKIAPTTYYELNRGRSKELQRDLYTMSGAELKADRVF